MGPCGKQQEKERKGWTEPGLYTLAGFADLVKSGKKKIFFGERCYDPDKKSNSRERRYRSGSSSLDKNNRRSRERYVSDDPGPGHYDDTKYESINKFGTYLNTKH